MKLAKIEKEHSHVKVFSESDMRRQLSILPLVAKPPPVSEVDSTLEVSEGKDLLIITPPPFKPLPNGIPSPNTPAKRPLARSAPHVTFYTLRGILLFTDNFIDPT